MMRKLLLVLFIINLSCPLFSQVDALADAMNSFKQKEYDVARTQIDNVFAVTANKTNASAWKLKGDIYFAYYENFDGGMNSLDRLNEILGYYKKAEELDKTNEIKALIQTDLKNSESIFINLGVQLFNRSDYEEALEIFTMAVRTGDFLGTSDSIATYNAALSAERAGLIKEALSWYDKSEALGYKGAACCSYSIILYEQLGDIVITNNKMETCLEKYPNDINLLTQAINICISGGNETDLIPLLQKAIEIDSGNHFLLQALAATYDGQGEFTKAEKYYIKALQVEPNYFEALYNFGALYFNRAADINAKLSEEKDPDKYLALKKELNDLFAQALPYLERAYVVNPDDLNTLRSLGQLYARMNNLDKYTEIKERIKELEGN